LYMAMRVSRQTFEFTCVNSQSHNNTGTVTNHSCTAVKVHACTAVANHACTAVANWSEKMCVDVDRRVGRHRRVLWSQCVKYDMCRRLHFAWEHVSVAMHEDCAGRALSARGGA
jgi:hypothetical protein